MKNLYKYEMLLVLPVPFRKVNNQLFIEEQAHHGVRRWLDSFESMIVAAPVMPEFLASKRPEISWVMVNDLPLNVKLIELPWAYRMDHFFRALIRTGYLLGQLIDESRYLQFAIGGLWGDWAAIGALIAQKKNRKYSIHTDRVEHKVILHHAKFLTYPRKLRIKIESFLMKHLERKVISACQLGLFHGMDTWSAYKSWMQTNESNSKACCIHNIHDEGLLEANNASRSITKDFNNTVHISYAGRFVLDKAPLQWLGVINLIYKAGAKFQATWAGDGPMRTEFEAQIEELGLKAFINTPGFIQDRSILSELYLNSDIFLFTHITPESPRCLLEALRLGIPIVGYDSEFARDLISNHQGGILVKCGDVEALAVAVKSLIDNPQQLNHLKSCALKDGSRFSSKAVFTERSNLIKAHLAQ